jgi:branched-chain amino acid transport system permease protein
VAAKIDLHPLLGLPQEVALAALLRLCLGYFFYIHMGGIYLCLITLALSEIVRIVINNEYEIIRGTITWNRRLFL